MKNKIILFELNEVPYRILENFVENNPKSAMAQYMRSFQQYETISEDTSSLSPWKTWPSLHRGVIDEKHLLHNFGQSLDEVDKEYPPVWELLAQSGIKAGVFGSLHTYPMPKSLTNYSYYFPDTFAAGSECFPEHLSDFQAFNLEMARESSRNVSSKVPWSSALKVISNSTSLGLQAGTYTNVAGHLLSERIHKWKKVRRRTYQTVLAFDIFMKQLIDEKPDFTTFFTNHVASAMHRYWAASFPEDYGSFEFSDDWVHNYSEEINFAMKKFDQMFHKLVKFIDKNNEYSLWITTSMGQEATVAEPLETQLYIYDQDKFMRSLGLLPNEWESRPSMLPRYNYCINKEKSAFFLDSLNHLMIDNKPLEVARSDDNFFMIKLGHENLYDKPEFVQLNGKNVSFESIGLENMTIDDKSNTTAYHIPTGMLLIYDSTNPSPNRSSERVQISTLDISPAILENYSVRTPKYMNKPYPIFSSHT